MSVPKLRFKEFDGDWLSAPLKKYFPKIRNGFVGVATPYYVEKGVKYLQGKNVKDGKIDPTGLIYISEDFHLKKNNSKLSIDDILMVQSGHVGECAVIGREYDNANCHALIVLSPHQEQKTNSHFVKYYFYTPIGKKVISQIKTGNTIEHVLASEIKEVELNFPSKLEQTKIASFLSNVDEKISQLTQKHELLSQYKQGMMQKLFSQQIRFKADDGSEFGEWEINIIRDVFTNKSKNFNPQNEGNLPCIELEHLSQNTGKILGTIESCEQQSTKNLFEKNSVLFGKLRPYLRKFAKPKFKGVCSSEIWVLTGLKISNDYLFQFVQSEQFTELTNIQSGSKMPRADWNVIADSEIEFPCLEEQTKIANFLSAIDQKNEVVAQKIEQAKQWKKGLLQQMFV